MHSIDVRVIVRHFTFRKSWAEGSPAGRTPSALLAKAAWGPCSHCLPLPSGPGHWRRASGLVPAACRSPGSRAALLPSIAIQLHRHTVNASCQLHRHVANTQTPSASPPDLLSGPYREEIAWADTAAAHRRGACIFSWTVFAPSSCCADQDTYQRQILSTDCSRVKKCTC